MASGEARDGETTIDGTLVLLIHASAMGPRSLAALAQSLARERRTIDVPALAGYGSDDTSGPGDPAVRNRAIVGGALAQSLHRRRIVFGHSMGGLFALLAALDEADRSHPLDALVLYEPILHDILDPDQPADAEALAWDRDVIAALAEGVTNGAPEHGVRRFIEAWNETSWMQLPEGARRHLIASAGQLARETAALPAQTLARERLACCTTPTLVLSGDGSPSFARIAAARVAEALPNARHLTLAGYGHMAPVTASARIGECIETFLAEQDTATGA